MAKKRISTKEKEAAILNYMKTLELTREEAEEVWLFDQEEIDNEEADAIEKKVEETAAEVEAKRREHNLDKIKTMQARKKTDAEKEAIITEIDEGLIVAAAHLFKNPQWLSSNKICFQGPNSNAFYTITLTKHKTQPNGYKIED